MDFQLNLQSEEARQANPLEPLVVEPEMSVRAVFAFLKQRNTGSVLICKEGALVGIFTERDALRMMADRDNLDQPIENVMIKEPVTLQDGESVGTAITKMSQGGYRRLPLIDQGGSPVGVVKVSGILHYLVEHFPRTIYTLPPTPHHMTQHREGA